jgi:hypothetical protein
MNFLRSSLLLAAALGCNIAAAATVQDLKPHELAAFLAKHDTVAVQFTSPDPKCRYCIGAAQAYTQAVAPARDPGIRFVRVQWPVWHKFPDFGQLEKPVGLPEVLLYRRSEVIGGVSGKPGDARTFLAQIQGYRDKPVTTQERHRAYQEAASAKALAALSPEEAASSRRLIRKDVVGQIIAACSKEFPDVATNLQQAYDAWVQGQKPALDKAATVMLTRSSREDAHATNALVVQETDKVRAWTVDALKIPQQGKPQAESCLKFAQNLGSLPDAGKQGTAQP